MLRKVTDVHKPSRSLREALAYALTSSFSAGAMNFVAVIYYMSNVRRESWGIFLTLMSVFALFQRILSVFDESIGRFVPVERNVVRYRLIGSVFLIKSVIAIPFIVLIIAMERHVNTLLHIENASLFYALYYLIALRCFVDSFQSAARETCQGFLLYNGTLVINIVIAFLNLLGVFIIVRYFDGNIVYYAMLSILQSCVTLSLMAFLLRRYSSRMMRYVAIYLPRCGIKAAFRNIIPSYTMPVGMAAAVSWLKSHAPNLVLGAGVGVEAVAIFDIVRRPFDFFHNFFGNLIKRLYPAIFARAARYGEKEAMYKKIFLYGLLARLLFLMVFIAIRDYYLEWMKIGDMDLAVFVFGVFGVDFLGQYLLTYLTLAVAAGKNTNGILISAVVRNVMSSVLLAVFFMLYEEKGIAISLLVSTVITIPIMWRHVVSDMPIRWIKVAYSLFALVAVAVSV